MAVAIESKSLTAQDLIAFEEDIKELYLSGKIRSPVHLSRGNEEQLINIFKEIKDNDWVFSTHRNHYHALLKGIPAQWLKEEILNNRSISISNSEYRFFTSAIVGGIVPIAMGVAWAIKRKGLEDKVWCFVGDMAANTGCFEECAKYSAWNELPITFIVEDNGWSVNTDTKEVWGGSGSYSLRNVKSYKYTRGFPHHGGGAGTWVNF